MLFSKRKHLKKITNINNKIPALVLVLVVLFSIYKVRRNKNLKRKQKKKREEASAAVLYPIFEHVILQSASVVEPRSFGSITIRYEYSIIRCY
jgi:hypothetical protein